jgi:hypothetical protein
MVNQDSTAALGGSSGGGVEIKLQNAHQSIFDALYVYI